MLEEISFSNFFNAVRRLLTQRRSLVDMLGQSNLVLTVKELIASIMVVNDNFLFHSWRKKGIQLKLNPPHTSHIDLFAFRVTLLTICFLMPKSYALLMSYWWFWEQRWLPLARLPYDPKESYSLSPTTCWSSRQLLPWTLSTQRNFLWKISARTNGAVYSTFRIDFEKENRVYIFTSTKKQVAEGWYNVARHAFVLKELISLLVMIYII